MHTYCDTPGHLPQFQRNSCGQLRAHCVRPTEGFRRIVHVRCDCLKEEAQKQKKPRSLRQGVAAYSALARHATTLGPVVLLKMLIAAVQKCQKGLYIAAAAALVTAVAEDKVKEIANICAELMRLGWVKLGSCVVIACLRQGYLRQTLPVLGVLIRQQDTDVLLQTIQGVTNLGTREEAAEVRQALLDEGYEMGRMFGRANQNTPRNADEAKQAAVSFAATASGTLAGAVAGVADSFAADRALENAKHILLLLRKLRGEQTAFSAIRHGHLAMIGCTDLARSGRRFVN